MKLLEDSRRVPRIPNIDKLGEWFNELLALLFPQRTSNRPENIIEIDAQILRLKQDFCLKTKCLGLKEGRTADICERLFDLLPDLRMKMSQDAGAILSGDPAAFDVHEVVAAYPGFLAVAIYRISNALKDLGMPYVPRILSEYAHTKTGIDIHPGASIGARFCIDHGTGVVIGETCEIGNDVKLYQGVTLGALSVHKSMAQTKRHPTIEDHVLIYSNATILGGETIIGRGSIIGGGVFITKSVGPNSKIYNKA